MREAPKSSWQRVTTVNADITSYCVQNVKEKKEYFFKIYAENKVGRSDSLVSEGVTIKSQFGRYQILFIPQEILSSARCNPNLLGHSTS